MVLAGIRMSTSVSYKIYVPSLAIAVGAFKFGANHISAQGAFVLLQDFKDNVNKGNE